MTVRSSPDIDDLSPPPPKAVREALESVSEEASHKARFAGYSWVNAWLERAETSARAGQSAEAYGMLEGILGPVLERPHLLETWLDLMRVQKPQHEEAARRSLQDWVRRASALLEVPAEACLSTEARLGILSRTLAQLYWEQGHREKALDIYRALVQRDPDNPELSKELEERLAHVEGKPPTASFSLRALERWAERIQRRKSIVALPRGSEKR